MTFGAASTADEVLAGVDLAGRTAVVTGATSGVGFETARALAAAGATVCVGARSSDSASQAIAALQASVPGGRFDPFVLDLASLTSVRAAAARLMDRHSRIDTLILNAGVMNTPFALTEDGFERQFGTNHLGHFALTLSLLPALLAGAPARVVSLSSSAHRGGDVVWEDLAWQATPYDKFRAYSSAKTATALFAVGLDQRFRARGIRGYAVHPGLIATRLHRNMTDEDIEIVRNRVAALGGIPLKAASQGAACSVWAATSPELKERGGVYIQDCGVAAFGMGPDEVRPYAIDMIAADRLWRLSEALTGERA